METSLAAQEIVPKQLGYIAQAPVKSFGIALKLLEDKHTYFKGLRLQGPFTLDEKEENSLKLMPLAFRLNRQMQKLQFTNVEVAHILVAEAFKAGLKKDEVTSLDFEGCEQVENQELVEIMCQGLQERSTCFELEFYECSSEFANPIMDVSYLKCFSLGVYKMDCSSLSRSVSHLFSRATLHFITLYKVRGLKESIFLKLARYVSMLPNLAKLDLRRTEVPTTALNLLHGSLKTILDSGRKTIFKILDLGGTAIGKEMCFSFFRLLRSDVIDHFEVKMEINISTEVARSVAATVANTKNLNELRLGRRFTSGTKFNNFCLQDPKSNYSLPFAVNPARERNNSE